MNTPKRHHWWPQLQIQYWANSDALIHAIRPDGAFLRLKQENIAIETNLYTFTEVSGANNTEIESWFASKVEAPFAPILKKLIQLHNLRTKAFKAKEHEIKFVKGLGLEVGPYLEFIEITTEDRDALSSYVAALLVRNPKYLKKIQAFHKAFDEDFAARDLKNISLNNMLHVYEIYKRAINKSDFNLVVRHGEHEFLFSDGGITVREPWSSGLMPFDLHVPLTPDLSLTILPYAERDLSIVGVARANNKAISYLNRVVLSDATRFVYSRGAPPVDFIKRFFGVPVPSVF